VRVVVSVDDVDGRRERRETNQSEQKLERVETKAHRNVVVPVRQIYHRTKRTQQHTSVPRVNGARIAGTVIDLRRAPFRLSGPSLSACPGFPVVVCLHDQAGSTSWLYVS